MVCTRDGCGRTGLGLARPSCGRGFFVGACLSVAGLIFQGVFRNPLAEPYLLGSASGAAVALLLPLALPPAFTLPALAFLGAWGASWLVLLVGWIGGVWQSGRLLLAGVALAALPSTLLLPLPSFAPWR